MTAAQRMIKGAKQFARIYVNVTEALMQCGVEEEVARDEARYVAMTVVAFPDAGEWADEE